MADSAAMVPVLNAPITTSRLSLRALEADDAATSVQLMTDPDTQRYFHGPLAVDEARRRTREGSKVGVPGYFCIVLRSSGERLGFVTLAPEKRTDDLAVSYALLSEHFGHGYGREAVPAILNWAFDNLTATQAPRIVAVTRVDNQRSRRLLETIGMSQVATFDEQVGQLAMYAMTHPGHASDKARRIARP